MNELKQKLAFEFWKAQMIAERRAMLDRYVIQKVAAHARIKVLKEKAHDCA